jgi:hypothetical protein
MGARFNSDRPDFSFIRKMTWATRNFRHSVKTMGLVRLGHFMVASCWFFFELVMKFVMVGQRGYIVGFLISPSPNSNQGAFSS